MIKSSLLLSDINIHFVFLLFLIVKLLLYFVSYTRISSYLLHNAQVVVQYCHNTDNIFRNNWKEKCYKNINNYKKNIKRGEYFNEYIILYVLSKPCI